MLTQLDSTTFEAVLPSGNKVEIGDRSSSDFRPQLKLNRWDGECFIKVALQTTEKHLPNVDGDKIHWDGAKSACEFLPTQDGYKFNIVLKERPETNVFTLDVETQNLSFFYQPELTPEEIAEGCFRPENAIGSYAVYHATRTNVHRNQADAEKYKCGKAFHWYRPLIWDAVGKECWGELNVDVDAGVRTVTIPQEFLNSAVYPVTIDDTFGYRGEGVSIGAYGVDTIRGMGPFAPTNDGTAIELKLYTCVDSGYDNGDVYLRGVIYKDSDLSRITYGSQLTMSQGDTTLAWRTLDLTNVAITGSVGYLLSVWLGASAASTNPSLCYDILVGSYQYRDVETYHPTNAPPATLVKDSTYSGRLYSIYCIYTSITETEILRPNAAGDETNIDTQFPDSGAHWEKVDEEIPDGDSTYLQQNDTTYKRDLFNLSAHSQGSGTINKVTVYAESRRGASSGYMKIALKSGTTTVEGNEISLLSSYTLHGKEWALNPDTSLAWTWADIDALQIGVALKGISSSYWGRCTQLYVEVDYTPAEAVPRHGFTCFQNPGVV